MKRFFVFFLSISAGLLLLGSCKQAHLYERMQNIRKAAWDQQQTPSFSFNISDTNTAYNVYVVLRHTNTYPYRNIWLNVGVQQQGDSIKQQAFDLPLAAADRWLGVGMDDIFEHRALLFGRPVRFNKAGTVSFTLQHTMRQNPLPGIMQAGIRVEPVR